MEAAFDLEGHLRRIVRLMLCGEARRTQLDLHLVVNPAQPAQLIRLRLLQHPARLFGGLHHEDGHKQHQRAHARAHAHARDDNASQIVHTLLLRRHVLVDLAELRELGVFEEE